MKKSKEIIGAPVISIAGGMQVGAVKGLVVNPQQKSVEFLLLKEEDASDRIKGIPFRYAEGVGEYAVTVENESVLMEISRIGILQELLDKNISIIGTKVITRKGKYLGDASEYSIDTETGNLKEIYYQGDNDNELSVPIQKVVTLGKEVLIVEEMTATEAPASTESSQANFKLGDEKSSGEQESQPVIEEPLVEQPVVEQPVVEQPAAELPLGEQTPVEQPVVEQLQEDVVAEDTSQAERDMLTSQSSGDLDPADAFIQKQRQFIIGKTLLKDLQSKEGEVIAWENEVVTDELFEKVHKIGPQKIMELAMSVRD